MNATAKEIRAWARANGITVGTRGRIGPDVRAAYEAAHADTTDTP